MDKALQEKFRPELREKYLKFAWEQFANYQFVGGRYDALDKQLAELSDKIEKAEAEIKTIMGQPDFHTVENKNKVKAIRETIKTYQATLEKMKPTAQKLWEEAIKLQEQAINYLERAEFVQVFNLKTPEEIQEAKDANAKTAAEIAKNLPEGMTPAVTEAPATV